MPRPPRSKKEIALEKEKIMKMAVELINDEGFEQFNMRKLGKRLGIAAKTIYNYYKNKDELYLTILANGFQELLDQCIIASKKISNPIDQLIAMGKAYIEFGITQSHYYNLMFTWNVPKYNDYANTSLENLARVELNTSLALFERFITIIRKAKPDICDEDASFYVIFFWSVVHGYISGYNNTLLNYMHHDPLSIKERIMETMITHIRKEFFSLEGKS